MSTAAAYDFTPQSTLIPRHHERRHLASSVDGMTLDAALREVVQRRWRHLASFQSRLCQAEQAIAGVTDHPKFTRAAEIDQHKVRRAVCSWEADDLSPSTIRQRLSALTLLGVDTRGCGVPARRVLKWWLSGAAEASLLAWIAAEKIAKCPPLQAAMWRRFAAYIRWTTRTGLRLEETLRLRWRDIHHIPGSGWAVSVAGTKTALSQATLPLAEEAVSILLEDLGGPGKPNDLVFGLRYRTMRDALWPPCRALLGASGNPTATLKSLRRSAARFLHVTKGMPLDMVRQYLRHENVQTTMEYLRLSGGYGAEEMRRWL